MSCLNMTKRIALYGFVCICLALSGCGGGGGSGGGGSDDGTGGGGGGGGSTNEKPTATIVFPPLDALHTGDAIVVRGTADDDSGVAGVSVNGNSASSSDGFATWTVTVPLQEGKDTLSVTVTDDADETATNAASVSVTRVPLPFASPTDIVHVGGTAYVLDVSAKAIFKVTAEGRTVMTSAAIGGGASLINPLAFAVSSDETLAYVVDNGINGIVKVDLATGDRSVIASNTIGTGAHLPTLLAVAYDDASDLVYALGTGTDSWTLATIHPDLSRTSKTEADSSGEVLTNIYDMEWEADLGLLIVMSRDGGVFSVDPAVGDPVRLTTPGDESTMGTLRSITVHHASDTVYILNNAGIIYSLDIQTPAGVTPEFDGSATFVSADALASVANASLLVVDVSAGSIYSVDVETDVITTYADSEDARTGSGDTFTGSISVVDVASGKAYVNNGSNSPIGIFDLATGARTSATSNAGVLIHGMTADPMSGRVFAINGTDLFEINASSGAVSSLASLGTFSGSYISGFTHDSEGNRLIYAQLNEDDFFEISLDTLEANVFSSAANNWGYIVGLAMDRQHNRLLYANNGDDSFSSLDLSLNERTTHISGEDLEFVGAVSLNADATAAYILDVGTSSLLRVDLNMMKAEVVAGPAAGSTASFGAASSLGIDETKGLAWAVWRGSLILFDLKTGDHVLISR